MMIASALASALYLLSCTAAQARPSIPLSAPVRTVTTFPAGSFVENIAVRSNGQLLLTLLSAPQLWLVDPTSPTAGAAVLLHEFPHFLGLTGIVELLPRHPDVFAVVAGNLSLTTGDRGAGSWEIWRVDLTGGNEVVSSHTDTAPKLRKIAAVPEATALNGLSVLAGPRGKEYLIVSDVTAGPVYAVDAESGEYAVVLNNTSTTPAPTPGFGTAAMDGVGVRGRVLYFDNAGQGTFNKVALEFGTGASVRDIRASEDVEVIARRPTALDQWDDFTFDCQGNVFIAAGASNTVQRIEVRSGEVEIIAGDLNSTLVAEPTSAKFGRREDDADVLYVTTAGGSAVPVNGDLIVPAQVLAIKTGANGSFC